MGVEDEKITRVPGETLSIKVSAEEEAYRKKYLPDAKKLTDEKLVCTVCSISLAQSIHKGKDLYIHRALQVLVCEACYKFYGDGCFSADEDGDDKYCRWCGQGGTLYLCSACNCAFCQKCTKQNLKSSVLAELENDDWKCYICNPRPLFGCRTICWGAQQLNNIGKEKEQERLRKVKERLEKLEARKKEKDANERRSRKVSSSEDETSKKRKRNSDGDSSSPEVIPKRNRRESRGKPEKRGLNGSIGRRRKDSSSGSESEEDKKTTRRFRTRNNKEKIVPSSSDSDSDAKTKKDRLKKKKKSKSDSDDSSEEEKRKSKNKKQVKKGKSDSESSEDEKLKKKKRIKKRDDSTDDSSDEKKKKKSKKNKGSSNDESPSESKKKSSKKFSKKRSKSSSDLTSDEDEPPKNHKNSKKKQGKENSSAKKSVDSDIEPNKKKVTESEETNHSSAEEILVKKRIKLAMLWLTTIVQDISELGTLISLRATNFSKKKINTVNLKSYDDILNCVSKIKQLISGVHANYDHIEKTLDTHLKPWKILTGLEEGEEASSMSVDGDVSKTDSSSVGQANKNSSRIQEESKVKSVNEKNDESVNWSDNSDDQNETRAMISKVNESLDKSQSDEVNGEDVKEAENCEKSNDTKNRDDSDSTTQTPNKNSSKVNEDEKNKTFESTSEADSDSNKKERSKTHSAEKEVINEKKDDEIMGEEDVNTNKELESEGDKENSPLGTDCGVVRHQLHSSEDEFQLDSFTSKLKNKWLPRNPTDVMNLKQSSESVPEKTKAEKQTSKEVENKSEKNIEDKETSKMEKSITNSKHKTKENEKCSFLSSSDEEEDSKLRLKKEEIVPKIVLKKLKNEEGFECEETKSSKTKVNKSVKNENNQAKLKEKRKENEECSNSDEEKSEKVSKKKKVSQNKSKTDKSNCLTSSDEDEAKQNSKTKKKSSSKKEDEKKSKEDKVKGSKEKEEKKIKKLSESNNKKKIEGQMTGSSSEEDSEVKKKEKKPKDKASDKTEKVGNKLESKGSRKSKLEKYSSDEEKSTKSKKIKLKKVKESNASKRKEKENSKGSKDSSEDEDNVSENFENGDKSDCERSDNGNQENSVSLAADQEVDESKSELNEKKDFSLELQASSTENTSDVVMVKEKEKEVDNDLMETNSEEKEADMKDENELEETTEVKVAKSNEGKSKFVGLDSSSDEEVKIEKKESPKKRTVRNKQKPRNVLVLSSDDEEMEKLEEPTTIDSSEEDDDDKDKKDEDFSVVVESSAESSASEILPQNKRKKKTTSDSDASMSGENKKKKKRRRVKCADSSDESGGSDGEKGDLSQKNTEGESPAKGGRKNIKKIKKKGDLEQTTIEAAEEEKERRRRIEERQKLFNQVFEVKESAKLDKLVLDFDPETKKELISVNKDLVAKMKPHQAKGVKFMWDSCFESVKQVKKTKGSGCILAHCMGLGKTFQVISLVHTLLTHSDLTKVHSAMVVCPLSTVLNWVNEFGKWLEGVEGGDDIEVFHLTKYNKNPDRARELRRWQHNGGVLVMGYEMFRNLTNETTKKFKAKMKKDFLETLIDPGADLIVCDEGHMLKNEATALSKAMTRVKTLRRIVLTGTPMQNNLKEYHCMVQFVKPNLLGTSKEFLNRFVNPINNGQFVDSTDHDVKLMKRRAHVLHKMLEGLVQRFDYNVLTPFLPPKQEYVISVCLSELQEKLYSYYLENESQKAEGMKGGARLFLDWQTLGRVWTHPRVLKLSTDKANWLKEKKAMEASDSEGSLKDFIDDDSEKSTTTEESSDDFSSDESGKNKKKKTVHKNNRSTRSTRQSSNVALLESSDEENRQNGEDGAEESANQGEWWSSFIEPHHFEDMRQSGKLLLLFAILKECELIEDKILVFSQSLFSLDLIEYFLDKIDAATQEGRMDETLDNHQGTWSKGLDYFRLDGSTSSENRNIWCKAFNREDNPRARLFLISTRAGGLGINLTAANRVIIFDASWNPSHDIQSIFRIYRFGQKKPCYVYRFVAFGTMEEKVYERQVAKQSISNRVVDEQQVHRHFSMNDLTELYTFTPASKLDERPTPALPRDPLMAEILSQMKAWIEKYHEHDSLLENVVEEELNEEERKAAWEDYENDKKRGFMPPSGPQGPSMNPSAAWNQQIEVMRQQLKLRYPTKTDEEINSILVYQVSILMRQQQQQQMQMAAQMQAANNMGFRPQMYGNNMMGQMGFNQRPQMQTTPYLRNIAPKPSSQQPNYTAEQLYRMQQQATQMRLQMQQNAAQQQQKSQAQAGKSLHSLLTNYPTANLGAAVNARTAAELQRMKMNYQASKQPKPGVVITELTEDNPSGSSES